MSWREKLNNLKQQASNQTQHTTTDARKILDEMGPDIPDIRSHPITKKDLEDFYTAARKQGVNPLPPSVTTHGWLLSLSRVMTEDHGHVWHLSASLHPRGRSSTPNDWKMLGHFVLHLGAPKTPMIMPEDPTKVIHWQWPEAA